MRICFPAVLTFIVWDLQVQFFSFSRHGIVMCVLTLRNSNLPYESLWTWYIMALFEFLMLTDLLCMCPSRSHFQFICILAYVTFCRSLDILLWYMNQFGLTKNYLLLVVCHLFISICFLPPTNLFPPWVAKNLSLCH